MWSRWKAFVATLGIDPYLNSVPPHQHAYFLQVFAHKVRQRPSPTGRHPIRAQRVQDYPRTVSQEIRVGSRWRSDPRYGDQLTMALELTQLHRAHSKADPPPHKVKPIPIDIVRWASQHTPNTPKGRAISNAIIVGYFWLLRPGEYTYCRKYNHPIRLQDTTLRTATSFLNGASAPPTVIPTASHVTLNFPDQKNGEKEAPVTHGDTSDSLLSPVQAVLRQVLHLRQHQAPPTTPLYSYYNRGKFHPVTAQDLTTALRSACSAIGAKFGLTPKDISVRALRNGGCVALIRAGVDPLQARLMGRWRSWAMLEYLQQSSIDTTPFAQQMLDSGSYVIPRHQTLPTDVLDQARPYLDD